ncbi:hypothetical protein [Halopseudomonas salegens]|uniref:Uncharacterized protein n=1 Tax=Halopseudomonas salegens TaxID=1434072 RepID=A0A1H2FEE6_9GAMM|nr:hypothetical protein [Halopseudomonas salegens]SDU05731.1 hypothetical protein SAMN05216210_1494 [Halopseudomonas salegens]
MKYYAQLSFVLCLIITPFSLAAQDVVHYNNPQVLDFAERRCYHLEMDRERLVFEDGSVVHNCIDYTRKAAYSLPAEDFANRTNLQAYLVCDTLTALPGNAEYIQSEDIAAETEHLFQHLDIQSFASSLRPQLEDERTLEDLASIWQTAVEGGSITLQAPDWRFELRLVAVLSEAANDQKQWLLWLLDEAKDGTYRDYAVLLARPGETDDRLIARRLPDRLQDNSQ